MATAWKEAHPDKPIVMVQLGWPNHTEVNSGRTEPFVEGVLSVDPTAENLGALDASAGQEAAKQIIVDLLTQRPEVNLIYSEASNLTVGTMAGLSQLGRGKFENGKPLTEIVASVDFDTVEFEQVYDPNSSLKVSMGLPPIETARGRIDLIMDVVSGKVAPTSDPAEEIFYKAYTVSYWTHAQGRGAGLARRPVRRQQRPPPGWRYRRTGRRPGLTTRPDTDEPGGGRHRARPPPSRPASRSSWTTWRGRRFLVRVEGVGVTSQQPAPCPVGRGPHQGLSRRAGGRRCQLLGRARTPSIALSARTGPASRPSSRC